MGTRGFLGFVIDDREKIGYNNFDSYPSELGLSVLNWVRSATDVKAMRVAASNLRVVTDADVPTDEDIKRFRPFTNTGVGARRERPDWYQLLRETQGLLGAILEAGVIEDASTFPLDSLFAEWGYLVDLDKDTFEVYQGFQTKPHTTGRFWDRTTGVTDSGYWPCALVTSWQLDDLPTDEAFMASVDPSDG